MNNNNVSIYKPSNYKEVYLNKDLIHDKLVKNIKVKTAFIVKSIDSEYPGFLGNSILLQLSEHNFISVGWDIYAFTITDKIVNYFSNMGNNMVPYPVMLGTQNVYFMGEKQYVPRKLFPSKMSNKDWANAYSMYYDSLEKCSFKIKNIKIIHKRII